MTFAGRSGPPRHELVEIVERLLRRGARLRRGGRRAAAPVRERRDRPGASDLIYDWDRYFAIEPTAEQIVDRALAHGAFDALGFPLHENGASRVARGLHFACVHFLRKRKSSLLIGVGEDAALVAAAIADGRPQVPG